MKRKIAWLGVSWLIVAALVLASCGPGVPEVVEREGEVITVNSDEVPVLSMGQTAYIIAAEIPKLQAGLSPEQQAVQIGEIEVTVSDVTVIDSYEYYAEFAASMLTKEAPPGMTFLIADVKIKNVGTAIEMMLGLKRMHAVDPDGTVYEAGVHYGGNELQAGFDTHPGDEMSGKVLFEIPKAASGVRIFYDYSFPELKIVEWEIE